MKYSNAQPTTIIRVGAAYDEVMFTGDNSYSEIGYDRSQMTNEQRNNFNRNVAREICQIKGIK